MELDAARELVEKATGLQTSTVSYCDHSLVGAFAGEVGSCDGSSLGLSLIIVLLLKCDHEANLLVKVGSCIVSTTRR